MSTRETIAALGSEFVRTILGSPCVVCGVELPVRRRVASCCVDCWRSMPRLRTSRCVRCAIPVPKFEGISRFVCLRCTDDPFPLDWIDSWGEYDAGLTKVLHALKFSGHDFLSEPLADLLTVVVQGRGDLELDAIVPVPMHASRERARGYNQADLLARGLARRLGIELMLPLLGTNMEGERQSALALEARRANVKGRFTASNLASGKRILVVDDICTTGETLAACGRALLGAGAKRVVAVTVARTP